MENMSSSLLIDKVTAKNFRRLCLAAAVSSAGVFVATPAAAFSLEEVIVTAQKRQESAQEVGMSITAVSGDSLLERSVIATSDLGKVVPGFVYTQTPRGTPIYTLRGIGFDDNSLASAPTVSIYMDEVSMAFPVMSRHTTFDLERVEVLKGPQGILFGQNSTGGAVNFIAAKPTEEFSAGLDVSYGRFNTSDVRGYVSGALSDTFRVRLSGMKIDSDEWQKSYTRDDELGEQDVFAGRFIAEWEPTEDLLVTLNLHGWADKSDTQAAQLLEVKPSLDGFAYPEYDAYPRSPNDARAADWDANPPLPLVRDDELTQGSFRVDYNLSDAMTLTSITSYAKYEQNFVQDTDGSDMQNFSLRNIGEIDSFSQELRLAGTTDNLEWIVGANYSEDDSADKTEYYYAENSVNQGFLGIFQSYSTADQDVKNYAFFSNVAWSFAEDLTLNLGARYTKDERDYQGCTGDLGDGSSAFAFNTVLDLIFPELAPHTIQPGGCTTSDEGVPGLVNRSLDEDNVSWRVGLDWQVSPDLLTYANISKGYKSGSIPAVNTASAFQIQPVAQESVLAYELGFKSELMENRAQFNAAAFYYDYSDKQLRGRILDPLGVFGVLETLLNIPESEVYGVEIDAKITPVEGLLLGVAASYVNTEVTKDFFAYDPVGNEFNYKGQSFPHTPELHITATANYEFGISQTLNGFVGADVLYQDDTTGLFNDPAIVGSTVASPTLRPGQTVDPDTFKVDSYATVDARLGVEAADGSWKAWLWGRNITDKYYWNNATQSLDNLYRLSSMPRTYGAAVSYRF
ncbi:MAG: TonB-dependent receptor [Porticoccaceae bacterium]